MQKRIITPYRGAPDLSVYEDEDLDSAFSPKPEAEVDHSCRYTNRNVQYLHIYSYGLSFFWSGSCADVCITFHLGTDQKEHSVVTAEFIDLNSREAGAYWTICKSSQSPLNILNVELQIDIC